MHGLTRHEVLVQHRDTLIAAPESAVSAAPFSLSHQAYLLAPQRRPPPAPAAIPGHKADGQPLSA